MGCLFCKNSPENFAFPSPADDEYFLSIVHDLNSNFIEIHQLVQIDRKLEYIIDDKDMPDLEYARQLLNSMRFELQSYLNYFNILIGKKSPEPMNNRRENAGMNPFYIEAQSYNHSVLRKMDEGRLPGNLDRSVDLTYNDPYEHPANFDERIKAIDQVLDRESLIHAKWFLIEIQRAKYLLPVSDLNEFSMRDPFVEIEVKVRKRLADRKAPAEYYTVSKTTSRCQSPLTPSWLEFIRFDIKELLEKDVLDLEEGFFLLRLMYCDRKNKKKTVQIGEEQRFSFKEIIDERVYDKTLTLKNLEKREIYAHLTFRCQLVHDYQLLCQRMRGDIETRLDVIRLKLEELKIRNVKRGMGFGASSVSFYSNNSLDVPLRGHEASSIPNKYNNNATNDSLLESKFYIN